MNNRKIEDLIKENESLKKENADLTEMRDAYKKKSEYLKKELDKATGGQKHMSVPEIAADLALTVSIALIITIVYYTSAEYGEGLFSLIKNAFSMMFN